MMAAQKHQLFPSSSKPSSAIEIPNQPQYDHHHASPSQPMSTLTSALQSTSGNSLRSSPAINIANTGAKPPGSSRNDSTYMSGLTPQTASGAMPISMNRPNQDQQRRESNAGSVMGGISWGGASVSSWVRDDIMMQGTSPYGNSFQSPSYSSSSYLPKLEANFMKDFTCCDLILPSLHDLLQHYEEAHAQQAPPNATANLGTRPAVPTTASTNNTTTTTAGQGQQASKMSTMSPSNAGRVQTGAAPQSGQAQTPVTAPPPSQNKAALPQQLPAQDIDALEDMEMDDVNVNGMEVGIGSNMNQPGLPLAERSQYGHSAQFGQVPSRGVPPLNLDTLNTANPLQNFSGIRHQSQPNTPVSAVGRPGVLHNNPTVSSVNTPTLSAHPLQQQQQFRTTPDSSAPGTPAELDPEFVGTMGSMSMGGGAAGGPSMNGSEQDVVGAGSNSNGHEQAELCIDDPAKRLFSPNNGGGSSAAAQRGVGANAARLGNAQYGPNSEIARNIREQQRKAGLADTVNGLNGEEPKPFRCPVIGCEKAYKNQNGLKYHKAHGHNNQELLENEDGTFSILDPKKGVPYPGTMGMEKEKPYKCEVCGKRYKNLNGLKYHKSHSIVCDTERRGGKTGGAPGVEGSNPFGGLSSPTSQIPTSGIPDDEL